MSVKIMISPSGDKQKNSVNDESVGIKLVQDDKINMIIEQNKQIINLLQELLSKQK